MPKPEKPQKSIPLKRKLPAIVLAAYSIALIIANNYKPQWFVDLNWWALLPLLPIEIWFLVATKKET